MYDRPFKWWVQSVMPLVFDDSLSYYEVLAKLTKYIEGLTGDVGQIEKILGTIEGIEDITQFTEFLENIQGEIGNLANLSTTSKSNLVSAINEIALKADIAYAKPVSGIPESDLSQSVRDKLNKTGETTKYIINNKELKAAPNNNSPADLGLGTYSVPSGGIPWDTLSQDVKDRIESGGGGTGGTTDYTELINKPQINGHTLNAGNNTAESLGLGTYSKPSAGIPETDLSAEVQEKLNTSGGIADNQESFVASRDYEAGELVYINGVLYKTKYKILRGTTMVPGNNIETTDISAELEKINSDIESLQSGAGPGSWSLATNVSLAASPSPEVRFFEYINVIGGETYTLIFTPITGVSNAMSYNIECVKRDGTVDDTFTYIYNYNQKRKTWTPEETGEYYFKATTNALDKLSFKAEIEYTESQGISELWNKVNEATQIEPRVSAVEALVGQNQGDIDALRSALSDNTNEILNPFNIFSYSEYEVGGFNPDGLNTTSNNRTRSKGFYPVISGYLYRAISKAPDKDVRISISWYETDDYNTPRISSTPWTNRDVVYDLAPENANYARILISYRDDSIITNSNLLTAIFQQVTNEGTSPVMSISVHPHTSQANINDYTDPGVYSFTGSAHENSPMPNFEIPAFLEVYKFTNDVILQRFTYINSLGGEYVRIRDVYGTWNKWIEVVSKSNYVTSADTDLNNLTDANVYIAGDVSLVNAPLVRPRSLSLIQNYKINSDLSVQSIIYIQTGGMYYRFKNLINEWSEWKNIDGVYAVHSLTQNTNFNDLTAAGRYSFGGITTENGPGPQNKPFDLHVDKWSNNCLVQKVVYPIEGIEAVRFRDVSNTWHDWHITSDTYSLEYINPAISKYTFNNVKSRAKTDRVMQDIAVYNGIIFDFFEGEMYVNGSSAIPITNGHGNNLMFGTQLHGNFPYLYCPSWIRNNCKIYVNEITENSATLVRTISFDNLQGYLNACVDESNNRIYGLLNTSETTYEGVINFIVAQLDNGTIISNTPLSYRIPIIQGMKFYDGKIYVASGDNSTAYPNKIMILNTDGNKLSETSTIHIMSEIEGFAIDNGKIYVADQKHIYT